MIAWALTAASLAAARPEPVGSRLLVGRRGAIVAVDPRNGGPRSILRGQDVAWSPDGTLVAFVRGGDLWLANADGSGRRPLTRTPGVVESEPAWAPGGRLIAYTALAEGILRVRVLRLPFGASRAVADEAWSPTWAPDGRLAFVTSKHGPVEVEVARPDGSGARAFHPPTDGGPGDIRDLTWSPRDERVAYTVENAFDGSTRVLVDDGHTITAVPGLGQSHPVWSPDGKRLAVESAQGVVQLTAPGSSQAVSRGEGVPLDWRIVPLGTPRFPDLVQRPPSGLTLTRPHGRWLLGFTSLVDNRGPGVLWIHATRPVGSPLMDAVQKIALRGGGVRTVPAVGFLHYTVAPPHYHWHLLGYDRYALHRAADFKVVVRDHKSGFCLADHYGIAQGVRHGPPRFLSHCGQFEPWLRRVDEGTSVGYTDRYPAFFHGQQLDLTGVPAGRYWLVHRVNSDLGLRELRYDNDAASLLIGLDWARGRPVVTQLRTCSAERC